MDSENVITAASLPDDIVVEILSRVPFKSFCRFKCVCKTWLAFSSNPFYHQKLPKIPSGILHPGPNGNSAIQLISLSPNDEQIDGALTFMPQYEQLEIVDCCNGLVLCLYNSCYSYPDTCSFIVCNPATREWRTLPVPESHSHKHRTECRFTTFLAFDPSWSAHFYVLNFEEIERTGFSKLEVFSSALSTWLVDDKWTSISKILVNKPHSFIGGVLHVQVENWGILVVEGLEAMSSSVVPRHSIIELPDVYWDRFICLGQAGLLHCAFPDENCNRIEVYSLDSRHPCKWSLKHRLRMQDAFGRDNFVMADVDYESFWCEYSIVALELDRGVLFLEEPFKLFSYDIDTGKLSEIKKDGHLGWPWPYYYYVAFYSKLPV